jgi:hypothetical protein
MKMIPDPFSRTVRIPVRIVNGTLCLFPEEGKLPGLKNGTIGDLIVSAHAFENAKDAAQFAEERMELFLPSGTRLIAEVNPTEAPDAIRAMVKTDLPGLPGAGVEIVLCEDQEILMRGTKPATLRPCKCSIPSLKQEATSINHAYTVLSQSYEPKRRSHTGNVFSKVFHFNGRLWQPLKKLRGH